MRAKITSITFIALLLFFFLFVVVLPKDDRASEKENRPLAEMPKASLENIFFGSFTTDFETYLTDKVGFRSYFVELGTKLDKLKGIEKEESEKVVTLASGGKLVLSNGKIMEVFKANKDAEKEYISALNKLSEKLDCEKYIMLAPTQLEFDESEYRHYADSQKETIENIYGGLKGFKTVNIYDSLKSAAEVAAKKTEQTVEISKLKFEIAKVKAETDKKYMELGELVYKACKGDSKAQENTTAIIKETDELFRKVKALLRELDETENAVTCKECGKRNGKDSKFCSQCGEKLN